jgi:hypothetical protein
MWWHSRILHLVTKIPLIYSYSPIGSRYASTRGEGTDNGAGLAGVGRMRGEEGVIGVIPLVIP